MKSTQPIQKSNPKHLQSVKQEQKLTIKRIPRHERMPSEELQADEKWIEHLLEEPERWDGMS